VKVRELMSRDVVAVTLDTPLRDVAKLLIRHGISGVPVCDDHGGLVGVVTEADILRKERGVQPRPGGPLAWLVDGSDVNEMRKAVARTAGEAMTSPAVTTSPWRTIAEAARLMLEHRVNRLPVLEGNRLAGIVTRADLVRAFSRPDDEIALEITEDAIGDSLWVSRGDVEVDVRDGEVTLRGEVQTRTDAELLARFVSTVPGVVGVRSELAWVKDDVARPMPRHAPTG
jgi:CBS domain-containing protein